MASRAHASRPGAGQSGKSTVAKQMKIIHMTGFSVDERKSYTSVICSNIVVSMRAILAACEEFKVKTSKSNKVPLGKKKRFFFFCLHHFFFRFAEISVFRVVRAGGGGARHGRGQRLLQRHAHGADGG